MTAGPTKLSSPAADDLVEWERQQSLRPAATLDDPCGPRDGTETPDISKAVAAVLRRQRSKRAKKDAGVAANARGNGASPTASFKRLSKAQRRRLIWEVKRALDEANRRNQNRSSNGDDGSTDFGDASTLNLSLLTANTNLTDGTGTGLHTHATAITADTTDTRVDADDEDTTLNDTASLSTFDSLNNSEFSEIRKLLRSRGESLDDFEVEEHIDNMGLGMCTLETSLEACCPWLLCANTVLEEDDDEDKEDVRDLNVETPQRKRRNKSTKKESAKTENNHKNNSVIIEDNIKDQNEPKVTDIADVYGVDLMLCGHREHDDEESHIDWNGKHFDMAQHSQHAAAPKQTPRALPRGGKVKKCHSFGGCSNSTGSVENKKGMSMPMTVKQRIAKAMKLRNGNDTEHVTDQPIERQFMNDAVDDKLEKNDPMEADLIEETLPEMDEDEEAQIPSTENIIQVPPPADEDKVSSYDLLASLSDEVVHEVIRPSTAMSRSPSPTVDAVKERLMKVMKREKPVDAEYKSIDTTENNPFDQHEVESSEVSIRTEYCNGEGDFAPEAESIPLCDPPPSTTLKSVLPSIPLPRSVPSIPLAAAFVSSTSMLAKQRLTQSIKFKGRSTGVEEKNIIAGDAEGRQLEGDSSVDVEETETNVCRSQDQLPSQAAIPSFSFPSSPSSSSLAPSTHSSSSMAAKQNVTRALRFHRKSDGMTKRGTPKEDDEEHQAEGGVIKDEEGVEPSDIVNAMGDEFVEELQQAVTFNDPFPLNDVIPSNPSSLGPSSVDHLAPSTSMSVKQRLAQAVKFKGKGDFVGKRGITADDDEEYHVEGDVTVDEEGFESIDIADAMEGEFEEERKHAVTTRDRFELKAGVPSHPSPGSPSSAADFESLTVLSAKQRLVQAMKFTGKGDVVGKKSTPADVDDEEFLYEGDVTVDEEGVEPSDIVNAMEGEFEEEIKNAVTTQDPVASKLGPLSHRSPSSSSSAAAFAPSTLMSAKQRLAQAIKFNGEGDVVGKRGIMTDRDEEYHANGNMTADDEGFEPSDIANAMEDGFDRQTQDAVNTCDPFALKTGVPSHSSLNSASTAAEFVSSTLMSGKQRLAQAMKFKEKGDVTRLRGDEVNDEEECRVEIDASVNGEGFEANDSAINVGYNFEHPLFGDRDFKASIPFARISRSASPANLQTSMQNSVNQRAVNIMKHSAARKTVEDSNEKVDEEEEGTKGTSVPSSVVNTGRMMEASSSDVVNPFQINDPAPPSISTKSRSSPKAVTCRLAKLLKRGKTVKEGSNSGNVAHCLENLNLKYEESEGTAARSGVEEHQTCDNPSCIPVVQPTEKTVVGSPTAEGPSPDTNFGLMPMLAQGMSFFTQDDSIGQKSHESRSINNERQIEGGVTAFATVGENINCIGKETPYNPSTSPVEPTSCDSSFADDSIPRSHTISSKEQSDSSCNAHTTQIGVANGSCPNVFTPMDSIHETSIPMQQRTYTTTSSQVNFNEKEEDAPDSIEFTHEMSIATQKANRSSAKLGNIRSLSQCMFSKVKSSTMEKSSPVPAISTRLPGDMGTKNNLSPKKSNSSSGIKNSSKGKKTKRWREYTDPSSGKPYYSNGIITTWTKPPSFIDTNALNDRAGTTSVEDVSISLTTPQSTYSKQGIISRNFSNSFHNLGDSKSGVMRARKAPTKYHEPKQTKSKSSKFSMKLKSNSPNDKNVHTEDNITTDSEGNISAVAATINSATNEETLASSVCQQEVSSADVSLVYNNIMATDCEGKVSPEVISVVNELTENTSALEMKKTITKPKKKQKKRKGWREYTDPNTGNKYYSNGTITTWDKPQEFNEDRLGPNIMSAQVKDEGDKRVTIISFS